MKRHSPRPNTVTLRRSREGQEKETDIERPPGEQGSDWVSITLLPAISHLGGREADAGSGTRQGSSFPHRPKCCLSKGFGLLGGGGIQSLKLGKV